MCPLYEALGGGKKDVVVIVSDDSGIFILRHGLTELPRLAMSLCSQPSLRSTFEFRLVLPVRPIRP